jgi:hypothetical protein
VVIATSFKTSGVAGLACDTGANSNYADCHSGLSTTVFLSMSALQPDSTCLGRAPLFSDNEESK